MSKNMQNKDWKSFFNKRSMDVLLVGALAILLFFVAWTVFHEDENVENVNAVQMSETEQKLALILQEIEGVGEASVAVCEEEGKVTSVVVVCEGAKDFRVVLDVREAVSTALNTDQKSVKIYLKKG